MSVINKRLERLATIISEDLESQNVREIWGYITDSLVRSQWDYFSKLPPEDIIKLTIAIYSLKKTGELKFAEKILENLFFFTLLEVSSEKHRNTCYDCDGDGSIRCNECDGTGKVDCYNCTNGKVNCDDCEGSGEVEKNENEYDTCTSCNGSGEENCDVCDGESQIECTNCYGDGTESCDSCGGTGDLEGDENEWEKKFICSWNQDLKNTLELKCETTENPFPDGFVNYDRFYNESILIVQQSGYSEFDGELEVDDETFCLGIEDAPEIVWENRKKIRPRFWIDPEDVSGFTV